eukprot:gene8267-9116_t
MACTSQESSSPLAAMKKNIFRSIGASALIAGSLFMSSASPVQASAEAFQTTQSGLQYRDLKVGDGAVPQVGDTVRVHYTGWLDGFDNEKKFDSSYDRRSPLAFKVGVHQVISGWDEGLLTDMHVGGKRELVIPPDLGYGKRGAGGVIPPDSTLYFRVELVGVGAR